MPPTVPRFPSRAHSPHPRCANASEGTRSDALAAVRGTVMVVPDVPFPPVPKVLAASFGRVVNVAGRGTECDTYVGRSFAGRRDEGWGNRHPVAGSSARARALALSNYWDDLTCDTGRRMRVSELAGRTLGCWCAPKPCHGHLLAGTADGLTSDVAAYVGDLRVLAVTAQRRLMVTGSRTWVNADVIAAELNRWWVSEGRPADPVLVVGDAPGADELAAAAWTRAGFQVEVFEARWEELGRRAGPVRNADMVASGIDACLAFPIGESKGTRGAIKLAAKTGAPVRVIEAGAG